MRTNLYCLPRAGGSAAMYHKWTRSSDQHVNVIPLELPGRGGRFSEDLITDLHAQADEVLSAIDRFDNEGGIALFGYSMGSLLAFEVALRLEARGDAPVHLFLGAMGSPVTHQRRRTHDLPEAQFLDEVDRLGGTPAALFADREMREIFVRILRADFELVETYQADPTHRLVHTDVTVLFGYDDVEVADHAAAWQALNERPCSLYAYPGDHFFIREQGDAVLSLVTAKLTAWRRARPAALQAA